MKNLWNTIWPYIKSHLGDKAMWVTILGFVVGGLNKWLKLGFDDTLVNSLVVALATYFVTHLSMKR